MNFKPILLDTLEVGSNCAFYLFFYAYQLQLHMGKWRESDRLNFKHSTTIYTQMFIDIAVFYMYYDNILEFVTMYVVCLVPSHPAHTVGRLSLSLSLLYIYYIYFFHGGIRHTTYVITIWRLEMRRLKDYKMRVLVSGKVKGGTYGVVVKHGGTSRGLIFYSLDELKEFYDTLRDFIENEEKD